MQGPTSGSEQSQAHLQAGQRTDWEQSCEKGLGVMVDKKYELAKCAHIPEKQPCPELHPEECGQQEGRGFCPLFCPCGTPPECCIQLWWAHNKNTKLLEQVQRGPWRWEKDWSTLFYKDRLGKPVLFSLEKRRLHGELTASLQQLKGLQDSWRGTHCELQW